MNDGFESWTLDTIREQGASFSWLEEFRFEWIPATKSALEQIMESKTIVLIVDKRYRWFERYILDGINNPQKDRPFIPIVSIDALIADFDEIIVSESVDIFEDMLALAYKEEYFFWYIGKGDNRRSDIAKRSQKSYIWLMDEEFQNAMKLHSFDKDIDIKLLQLYYMFERSLSAVLFGETHFDG